MKAYHVTISFKRIKHTFSVEVQASDEQSAQFAALRFAQGCGYHEIVKGYKVMEV